MTPPSHAPEPSMTPGRGKVWLRALLFLPLLLAGFIAVDGRGLPLALKLLSGGDGAPSLHARPSGSSEQAAAELAAWRQAQADGQPLEVLWGPTPAGWISIRSAATGQLRLANR